MVLLKMFMKIWLHRISYCSDISEKLLENGYISIGFSDFANTQFLENTINEKKLSCQLTFKYYWLIVLTMLLILPWTGGSKDLLYHWICPSVWVITLSFS